MRSRKKSRTYCRRTNVIKTATDNKSGNMEKQPVFFPTTAQMHSKTTELKTFGIRRKSEVDRAMGCKQIQVKSGRSYPQKTNSSLFHCQTILRDGVTRFCCDAYNLWQELTTSKGKSS